MGLWDTLQLDIEEQRLIAFVGGGGKTTTIYALAREARERGKSVVVTTTTHMLPHPGLFLTDNTEAKHLRELLFRYRVITVGRLDDAGKLVGVKGLAKCKAVADVVLVEADGSRLKPLKAPADYEPVIPPESDAVVAVCGLDCVGGKIQAVCHRPELVSAIVDKPVDAELNDWDVANVLLSRQGGRKNIDKLHYACVFNKADTDSRRAHGEHLRKLMRRCYVPAAVTSYTEEEQGGLAWFKEDWKCSF